MARKRRKSDASDDDSQDSDYDASPRKKKSGAAIKKAQTPKVKAEIIIRATDVPMDEATARDRLNKIDSAVLDRIKKALALGNHEATSEQEARAALRTAARLLDKHNVSQADILSQETDAEKLKRAGTSVVSVRSTSEPPIAVNVERWASKLNYAMTIFFDCQSYSTAYDFKVEWAFYGLAEQTVTAALAFEMTYNLISAWSLKPSVGSGVHQRNCYRIGVADGLVVMAEEEKKEEKKQIYRREQALIQSRRDAEKADELARIARLNGPVKTEEGVGCSNPAPKDIRVKVEEVEDEDATCNLHSNAPKREPGLFENNQDVKTTPDWDDGPNNWRSVLEPSSVSSDDMSDDDSSEGGGISEQSDFLPADFHDNDDLLDLDTIKPGVGSLFPSCPSTGTMGPPSSTVPIAEQKAGKGSEDDAQWSSLGQLVAFRESSVAIAEDYLKSQGIKLTAGRRIGAFTIQNEAGRRWYRQGREDAKLINVRSAAANAKHHSPTVNERRKLLKDAEDD